MRPLHRRLFIAGYLALLGILPAQALELQKFTDVRMVENPSNDGDSFVVQAGDKPMHLRLYFVDCPESVATTDADAKRVREQARYFGITDAKKIFEFGREAKKFTDEALCKPFTIYTAFASALGRSPGGRIYAFVITHDGKDLAQLLIEHGYARAYGSKRSGPDNRHTEEIQKELQRLEIAAMRSRTGTWAATDAKQIDRLRAEQREEDSELKDLLKASAGKDKDLAPGSVDLNTASTGELQAVSGIGPLLAAKIIAGRPYKNVDDLLRVSGMGPRLLERVRPFVVVREPSK
ncbi:MAG: helix-hairpin-helix domain-containing protein [Verrucomicrobiota bacterium]